MVPNGSAKAGAGEQGQAEVAVSKRAGRLQRGRRILGYFFWYMPGLLLDRALPQLVLFPLALHLLGKESFGRFGFALGIVNIIGMAPSKGLNNATLRNFAGVAESRRPILLRTAFTMQVGAIGIVGLLAIAACLIAYSTGSTDTSVALWIAVLVVAIGARNIVMAGMVDLGVTRRFAQRSFWQNVGSTCALVALPAILLFGEWGLPIGFAAGHLLALALLLVLRRDTFIGKPQFDAGMARGLGAMWALLFLSTFFFLSSRYVHRTVLGASADTYGVVAVFVAAAAILDLFMMPLSITGLFGFQLLSAHPSAQKLPVRFLRLYAFGAVAACVCFYGVTRWLAPWPLRLLYPNVAAEALAPMNIMLPGMAITVLMHASRPFVLKFSRWRTLLLIGIASFLVHVGGALLLVPRWGITGAAWAYCIGSAVVALAWFACFVIGFLRHGPRGNGQDVSIDNIDPG